MAEDGRWVTVTPLDPEIAEDLRVVLAVAAALARAGRVSLALTLRDAHDRIKRNLTETPA